MERLHKHETPTTKEQIDKSDYLSHTRDKTVLILKIEIIPISIKNKPTGEEKIEMANKQMFHTFMVRKI